MPGEDSLVELLPNSTAGFTLRAGLESRRGEADD
jgi:hypothetical protein